MFKERPEFRANVFVTISLCESNNNGICFFEFCLKLHEESLDGAVPRAIFAAIGGRNAIRGVQGRKEAESVPRQLLTIVHRAKSSPSGAGTKRPTKRNPPRPPKVSVAQVAAAFLYRMLMFPRLAVNVAYTPLPLIHFHNASGDFLPVFIASVRSRITRSAE